MTATLLTPAPPEPSTTGSGLRARTRETLRTRHLRTALRTTPADATVAAALRCGGAVAVALVAFGATGRQDLAGFACLGALTSLYGRYDAYRRRAALLAVVGTAMVVAIALTTTVTALGAPTVVTLAVVALVAAAMTGLCHALQAGPPGATIVVFAAGAGMAGSPVLADLGPRVGAGAFGAAAAWVVCCAGRLWWPTGPARIAVARAATATSRAVADGAAADSAEADRAAADRAAADRAPADRAPADAVARSVVAARATIDRARALLAHDASVRRTRGDALRLAAELDALERTLPDRHQHSHQHQHSQRAPHTLPPRRTLRALLRAGTGAWRLPAGRVAVGSTVAAVAAHLVGFGHPAWAGMGATATLQGATAEHTVVRGLQRAGGTALGALLAWPLLGAHLGFWATGAAVVGLQVVTEIVVGRHYGLAMLTITPMALLMTSLGAGGDPAVLARDRALDTVLGAVVAVATLLLLSPRHRPAA